MLYKHLQVSGTEITIVEEHKSVDCKPMVKVLNSRCLIRRFLLKVEDQVEGRYFIQERKIYVNTL